MTKTLHHRRCRTRVRLMLIHASCAASGEDGVLLVGPPGCGKSDLLLRLLDLGFTLVADDQVLVVDGLAAAPPALRGLMEIRGIGIMQMDHRASARIRLVARLGRDSERLPRPFLDPEFAAPCIHINAFAVSAALRLRWALACVLGKARQTAGMVTP